MSTLISSGKADQCKIGSFPQDAHVLEKNEETCTKNGFYQENFGNERDPCEDVLLHEVTHLGFK